MAKAPAPIESINRALMILDALSQAGPKGMALVELSAAVELNKSTVYRALHTLRLHNYVAKDEESGRYSLGLGAIILGSDFFDQDNLATMLHTSLLNLSHELGELVHLGIPAGVEILYVDKVEPARAVQVRSRVGQTISAVSSAMGRAIMAQRVRTSAQLEPYMTAHSQRVAGSGQKRFDSSYLWKVLEETRERGYSMEIEENESGVSCMGVALLRKDKVVGAISVTGLVQTMTPEYMSEAYAVIRRLLGEGLPLGLSIPQPLKG
ncbi:IclR family transcriptional regulator [Actinomycetaceae bacterium TAE3-ERU4]|nr:IclR family transcriptional regulator [Actinomycetaceae bacterium TAE3-ERU4]